MKSTINIDLNYDGLKDELPDIEYGSNSIDLTLLGDKLTRSGYILQGFYYIDGENETLVLDKDGNVINLELLNSLIVAQKGGTISTLTAKWQKNSKVCFKTKDGSTTFGIVDYINGQGTYTPSLKDNYYIEGWYDSDGNKVLNSDGSVVDGINLTDEATVFARFKTIGYVVSSTMDSNSTYVITSETKIMTASGSSISSSDLTSITDTSGNAYIPSSSIGTDALWTYDGSSIMNENTKSYLAAYSSSWLWYTYYYLELQNSKNIDSWSYSDGSLVRKNNYYVYSNENSFNCSADYSSNIVLYEFSKDIITENYE